MIISYGLKQLQTSSLRYNITLRAADALFRLTFFFSSGASCFLVDERPFILWEWMDMFSTHQLILHRQRYGNIKY